MVVFKQRHVEIVVGCRGGAPGKSCRFTSEQYMQQTGRQVLPWTLKFCRNVLLGGLRAFSLRYNRFPVFGRSVRNGFVGGIRVDNV